MSGKIPQNPQKTKRMFVMQHNWIQDIDKHIDALEDFGFGGAVTNVPGKNGFTANPENLKRFSEIMQTLKARSFDYWLYDESGYPSGQCSGGVLASDPNLTAKGMYMRKFEAFNDPLNFVFTPDCPAHEIVWAMKYPMDLSDRCEAKILFGQGEKTEFSSGAVTVELNAGEIMYVFIVKDAYEGSHCVHNISSRNKYINILDENAVKRFIELSYAPVAHADKDAFKNAGAVFTDEPSLMVAYARDYETFSYALLPYEKTLLNKFSAKYGYDLRPYLPLLFEDSDEKCRKTRVDFYELIGEVVSSSYVGQINEFCKAHGTCISGHYLAEEHVAEHVLDYGNYVSVLMKTGYPGMDILKCLPYDFEFTAPKFLEMIARKKGTEGFMVEFCPFFEKTAFDLNAFENTVGCLSILYMYGARRINTYLMPDLSEYDPKLFAKSTIVQLSRKESRYINDYVARLGTALDARKALYGTYVYYAIEDVQAKLFPKNFGGYFVDSRLSAYDISLKKLSRELLTNGVSFGMADGADFGSGLECKNIILPDIAYITQKSADAIVKAAKGGTKVYAIGTGRITVIETGEEFTVFEHKTEKELCELLKEENSDKIFGKLPKNVLRQEFGGGIIFVYNNNTVEVELEAGGECTVFDPTDGSIEEYRCNDALVIKPYRAVLAYVK